MVAPELIGCLLVKRQEDGSLLWGVITPISPMLMAGKPRARRNRETQELTTGQWEGVRKQWQLDAKRPDTPAARRRCRQLIELGPAYVSWDDVVGRR